MHAQREKKGQHMRARTHALLLILTRTCSLSHTLTSEILESTYGCVDDCIWVCQCGIGAKREKYWRRRKVMYMTDQKYKGEVWYHRNMKDMQRTSRWEWEKDLLMASARWCVLVCECGCWCVSVGAGVCLCVFACKCGCRCVQALCNRERKNERGEC